MFFDEFNPTFKPFTNLNKSRKTILSSKKIYHQKAFLQTNIEIRIISDSMHTFYCCALKY